ncbi:golgin subfamily A member 6-like protein 22 [Hoplias malabaricus]|uniref:golgin subfamily A member 6-like protein 22 n=1 Tax=Hoplias malabaricus TaxID=27720 RepID=UPI003462D642
MDKDLIGITNNNNNLRGAVSKPVKRLLNEFKSVYEEKIKRCGSQEENLQMKVRILHSYVNDLSDQNQVLVQTVEELEKEANEKVAGLEMKLRASDKAIHDLGHKRKCLEEDNRHLRAELHELKADTFTLSQVKSFTLRSEPLEKMSDHSAPSTQSLHKPGDLMKAQVVDLWNQLKAKNGIIQSLQEEIKMLLFHSAQKKNEEAMLLVQNPELERAQITSGDVINEQHTKIRVDLQEEAASDGEGSRAIKVLADLGNPNKEAALRFREKEQERIMGRVLNSESQKEVEVFKLTSGLERLQLHQGKASNSSAHSTSQDPREQKPCGPDNSGPCEADRAVLLDRQWNFRRRREHLQWSHKQLGLKQEQVKGREEKAKAASPELQEREGRVRWMQQVTEGVGQDDRRRTLTMKEQQLAEEHSHTLHVLQSQLQTSKEKVNRLGLEVGLLKSKLQEETEQSQQLRDQILKQQEALSRASASLKDTRRAAGNKIHKRENKLSVAHKQLQEANKQLSDRKKECLQMQKDLEKLQVENAGLAIQLKENSQDRQTLTTEKRKVEQELSVVTEKHRAVQQEVAGRDQVILQLRMELRVLEEKHEGAQKELVLQEAEVSRLNERVRRQQGQLQELREMCRRGEAQLEQKEQDKQQLQSQLQLTQQQLKCEAERLERKEGELTASRQGHAADTERWNQRNLLLHKQLQQLQQENTQHNHILPELRDKLNQSQHALQLSQEKVAEYETLLKKCDGEIKLMKQHLEEVQKELSECKTSVENHQSSADIFKLKYMAAMEKVQQLQAHNQRLEEDAQLFKKQVEESQAEVSSLRDEVSSLECRYETKAGQMERWEEAMEQLTEELLNALDHQRTREETNLRCVEEMERLKGEVAGQQKQMSDYEGKCLQLQTDLTSYQEVHSYSNEQYEALQTQLELSKKQKEEEVEQVKAKLQATLLALHSKSKEAQEICEEKQNILEEKKQNEEENKAVRDQLTLLDQQLQQLLKLYTDKAGQEEKAVLFWSSWRSTEEQLSQNLEYREKQDKYEPAQLQNILQSSQKSSCESVEGTAEQQRHSCKNSTERQKAREQMSQQDVLVYKLREELEQERGHYEDQLHIRNQPNSETVLVRRYEERVSERNQQLQGQREGQQNPDDNLLLLKREHAALQYKYDQSLHELQQSRQTLEEALTDNTHLQQETKKLVTIISHWIKEHRAASEGLARRIKEQNGLLAAISVERE